MATLETFLTSIADAIREKKGTTEPINASNFASEILSIQGGASLNVAYSLTPPTDTTKIWLACEEPQAVEVQNYLGNVSLSNVAYYGEISNPVSDTSYFNDGYFNTCYIGNNQIAIVGYNHIRIYDVSSKNYIADYTISAGTSYDTYTNVLYRDNVLYFGYGSKLYSFDLTTQTLTQLYAFSSRWIYYIFFYGNNKIDCLMAYNNYGWTSYHYRYDLEQNTYESINSISGEYFEYSMKGCAFRLNYYVYNFYMRSTTSTNYYTWKYNISNKEISVFTSFYNFMTNLGWTEYYNSSTVYDGERFIYLIGGYGTYNGTSSTKSDLIIKYDTVNDSFEVLDQKLIGVKYSHFSVLVDGRVYIFGGEDARKNVIDYFDISFPLPQNNAIITIANYKDDNALPLINTDKLKLNSNIASAYKGNANNLAEKVNAYYWNGTTWKGINCEDYVGSSGTGGGLNGGGNATTDPEIPVDKPVEI